VIRLKTPTTETRHDDNRNSAAGAAGHRTGGFRWLGQPSGGGNRPPPRGPVDQSVSQSVSQPVSQSESQVTMITIENATVETLGQNDARPVSMGGRTQLSVTIGDHSFDMWVDEAELIEALASQYV